MDFINCRISEKSVDGPPSADDLVAICKSVGVEFTYVLNIAWNHGVVAATDPYQLLLCTMYLSRI